MPSEKPQFDVYMYRGDDCTLEATAADLNGIPISLAGGSAVLTVRDSADGTLIFSKSTAVPAQGVIADAARGKAEFYIVPPDTSALLKTTTYMYDVKITTSQLKTYTIAVGNFVVKLNVKKV